MVAGSVSYGQDPNDVYQAAVAHFDDALSKYDFNGDGATTAEVDGILYARYALGFRGSALTSGLAAGTSRTTSQIEAALAACQ
jgi:hypothetical protein